MAARTLFYYRYRCNRAGSLIRYILAGSVSSKIIVWFDTFNYYDTMY